MLVHLHLTQIARIRHIIASFPACCCCFWAADAEVWCDDDGEELNNEADDVEVVICCWEDARCVGVVRASTAEDAEVASGGAAAVAWMNAGAPHTGHWKHLIHL